MTIPNQTNIIDVVKSQLEEYTKLINVVNTTIIKCSESNINPKTVVSVRETVSNINSIILIFSKNLVSITNKVNSIAAAGSLISKVFKKNPFEEFFKVVNVVDEVADFVVNLKHFNRVSSIFTIRRAIKNVKQTISLISNSTIEIAMALAELKLNEKVSKIIDFTFNPGKYIKKLWNKIRKSSNPDNPSNSTASDEEKDQCIGVLQLFVELTNIVASISKAGQLLNFWGVVKARVMIKMAFKSIINIHKYMLAESIKFQAVSAKITEKVVNVFKNGIGNIIESLGIYTDQILTILKEYTVLGKSFIKNAVKSIFSTYWFILSGIIKISRKVGLLRFAAMHKGMAALAIAVKFLSYSIDDLYIIMTEMEKFKSFNEKDTANSIKLINTVIGGVYELIEKIAQKQTAEKKWTGFKNFFEQEILVLLDPVKWVLLFNSIKFIMEGLSMIGKEQDSIKTGIKVVDQLFTDNTSRDSNTAIAVRSSNSSILDIFSRLGDYAGQSKGKINGTMLFIAKVVGSMGMIISLILLIKLIGDHRTAVEKGLKTLDVVLFGSHHWWRRKSKRTDDNKQVRGIFDIFTDERWKGIKFGLLQKRIFDLALMCGSIILLMMPLILVGNNWFKIRMGLWTLEYITSSLVELFIELFDNSNKDGQNSSKNQLENRRLFNTNITTLRKNILPMIFVISGLVAMTMLLATASLVVIPALIAATVLRGIVKLVGKIIIDTNKVPEVPKGVFRLNFIMSSLVIAATAITAIGAANFGWKTIGSVLAFALCYTILMTVVLATLTGLDWMSNGFKVGSNKNGILKGIGLKGGAKGLLSVAKVAAFSIILMIVGHSLVQFSKAIDTISKINYDPKKIGAFALCMLSIIGIVTILSFVAVASPFALVGIGFFVLIMSAVIVVAKELEILATFKDETLTSAEKNAVTVLGACQKILNLIVNSHYKNEKEDGNTSAPGFWRKLWAPIGLTGDIISMILGFGVIVTSLLAITAVILVGAMLNVLADDKSFKISTDTTTGPIANAKSVIDAGYAIMDLLDNAGRERNKSRDKGGNRGPLRRLIGAIPFIGGVADIIDGILAFGNVVMIFASIGIVCLIGVLLQQLDKIKLQTTTTTVTDSNGETTTQTTITTVESAKTIIDAGYGVMKCIEDARFEKNKKRKEGGNRGPLRRLIGAIPFIGGAADMIDAILDFGNAAMIFASVGMVSLIAKSLQTIQDTKVDKSTISDKITGKNGLLEISNMLVEKVSDSNIKSLKEEKVKLYGKYVDDTVKYFKGINDLKVDNVKSLGDMYAKMGEFMDKLQDAPINEIADALVNKISPALSSINDTITNVTPNTTPVVSSVPVTTSSTTSINTKTVAPTQQVQAANYLGILEEIEETLETIKTRLGTLTSLKVLGETVF